MMQMLDGHVKGNSKVSGETKSKPKGVPTLDVYASMNIDSKIRPFAIEKRKATGKMMDSIYKDLIPYVERAEFPRELLVGNFRKLGINGLICKDFGSPGFNTLEMCIICFEIAKRDVSVASGYLIHHGIGIDVIDKLGNEE